MTSYLFPGAKFSLERLQAISDAVGKDRLVVDVSCRKRGSEWIVAMDKWQTMTDMKVSKESLDVLAKYCSEFLVHAADVEGLCKGIDGDLVKGTNDFNSLPLARIMNTRYSQNDGFHLSLHVNSVGRVDNDSYDICRRRQCARRLGACRQAVARQGRSDLRECARCIWRQDGQV